MKGTQQIILIKSARHRKKKDKKSADTFGTLQQRGALHPTRKIFHAVNATVIILAHESLSRDLGLWALGFITASAWLVELGRLNVPAMNSAIIGVLGPIVRVEEVKRLNGIAFYLLGLFIVNMIFIEHHLFVLAAIFLGYGDPVAALTGALCTTSTSWGPRFQLTVNGKSLAGAMAMFMICSFSSFFYLIYIAPFSSYPLSLTILQVCVLSIIGPTAAVAAELFIPGPERPKYADDNFNIPVVSAFVLYWVSSILGCTL